MKSKLYGPSAHVTHSAGFAQWRTGWPSRPTAIQSGCAAFTSSRAACGSVRATTRIPIDRHPESSVPNGSESPSHALR